MRNPALYYFAGAVLMTLITTAVLCRRLIVQKKRAFYLTGLVGDLLANAVWFMVFFLSGRIYAEGWHVFTREAWASGSAHSLASAMSDGMIFVVVGSLICILPALGVAYYYGRQSKKNETSVA